MSNQNTIAAPPVSPQFYSLAEVALILGVSKRLVMEWTREGRLPVFRLGPTHRVMRVRKSDLEKFIDTHIHSGNTILPTSHTS
jgi:excisionase family DNA binding protein